MGALPLAATLIAARRQYYSLACSAEEKVTHSSDIAQYRMYAALVEGYVVTSYLSNQQPHEVYPPLSVTARCSHMPGGQRAHFALRRALFAYGGKAGPRVIVTARCGSIQPNRRFALTTSRNWCTLMARALASIVVLRVSHSKL